MNILAIMFIKTITLISLPMLAMAEKAETTLMVVAQSIECQDMGIDASDFAITISMPKSAATPTMPSIEKVEGFRFIDPTKDAIDFNGGGLNDMCQYYASYNEINMKGTALLIQWMGFQSMYDVDSKICRERVTATLYITPTESSSSSICYVTMFN